MNRYRLEITKQEEIRYISHLDYSRTLERALRRAKLPVVYSEGFNPHMKMAFASALAVGVTSDAEYLDLELAEPVSCHELMLRLNPELPAGIAVKRIKEITARHAALMAVVNLAIYLVKVPLLPETGEALLQNSIRQFNGEPAITYIKESPKGKRIVDVKRFMADNAVLTVNNNQANIRLSVRITPQGSIKPSEIIEVLINDFGLAVSGQAMLINRCGLYIADKGGVITPLEL